MATPGSDAIRPVSSPVHSERGGCAAAEDSLFFCRNDLSSHGRFTRDYLRGLGLERQDGYFNAGVLAADRKTWCTITSEALAFFKANVEACKFHDQSALNAVAGRRRIRLDPRWNFQTLFRYWHLEDQIQPAIYHFTQTFKPWNGPIEPWSDLFEPYQAELEKLRQAGLPLKTLDAGEVEQANALSNRLKTRLKWLMPLRLRTRKRALAQIQESAYRLNAGGC